MAGSNEDDTGGGGSDTIGRPRDPRQPSRADEHLVWRDRRDVAATHERGARQRGAEPASPETPREQRRAHAREQDVQRDDGVHRPGQWEDRDEPQRWIGDPVRGGRRELRPEPDQIVPFRDPPRAQSVRQDLALRPRVDEVIAEHERLPEEELPRIQHRDSRHEKCDDGAEVALRVAPGPRTRCGHAAS